MGAVGWTEGYGRDAGGCHRKGEGGRPPKHGGEFVFGDPTAWGTVQAWDRPHPSLTGRAIRIGLVDACAEMPRCAAPAL